MQLPRFLQLLSHVSHRGPCVQPGLYHYELEVDGTTARFHLRVDRAGDGLLLANAAAMSRLTSSGVIIARGLLEGHQPSAIVDRIKRVFRGATTEQIAADVAEMQTMIQRMEAPNGAYPIFNLTDPAISPKALPLERPISADVPLCPRFHMRQILDRLWKLGIPHVTIVVGRNPDKSALIHAVERAGDLGLIVGVRGRGTDLDQSSCISDMVAAGLDHLDVYCFSKHDAVHNALAGSGDCIKAIRSLANARKHEVCPVAQIALVQSTLATIDETLESLAKHGLADISVYAIAVDSIQASGDALLAHELAPAARQVEELAERLGLRLLWYPTVRFDAASTLGEQACRGPRTSGDTAIRVEPDGSVIPARGPFQSAGNLIDDDWETIEKSDIYQSYRRRIESDTRCDECPGLTICATDCPREPAGWAEFQSEE